jgi:hypothetical protein
MSRVLPSIALASLVVLSGCVFVETVQQPEAAIDFNGTINTTGEEIQIDGQIRDEFDFTAEHTYRDVVVCVYDGNETLLHKTPPRDMGPSSSRINVSITVDTVPEFVVVNSTDFWRDDRDVEVAYFVVSARNDESEQLRGNFVENPESIPVQGCTA